MQDGVPAGMRVGSDEISGLDFCPSESCLFFCLEPLPMRGRGLGQKPFVDFDSRCLRGCWKVTE